MSQSLGHGRAGRGGVRFNGEMRLNAWLARAGVASRRKSDELIKAGRVTVNGEPGQLNTFVQRTDDVRLDGEPLQKQQLATTGRPGEIAYQQVGDIKVAILGFAPYKWAQPLTNIPAARRLVKKAAANADVVIVTMHAGAEGSSHTRVIRGTEMFLGENRGNSRAFTHAVVDAGADLVIGSGPHVLRGMEWYRGHLIAYSLGNFAGYKVFSLGGPLSTSGILRVTLRGNGAFDSGTLVPTRMVGGGIPALDPAESAHGIVRTLSREDFGAHAVKVSAIGGMTE